MDGGGPLSFLAPKIFFIPAPLRLAAGAAAGVRRGVAERERGGRVLQAARAERGVGFRKRDVDGGLPVKTRFQLFLVAVGSGLTIRSSISNWAARSGAAHPWTSLANQGLFETQEFKTEE